MTTVPLLETWVDWYCPNCGLMDRTRTLPADAVRFHTCPALHHLVAPLVAAGTDCKVVAEERGDYLNGEEQRTGDDGKPYSAVRTVHADGHTDAAVFPGVAVARIGDYR
jgi:hypothetical protein